MFSAYADEEGDLVDIEAREERAVQQSQGDGGGDGIVQVAA